MSPSLGIAAGVTADAHELRRRSGWFVALGIILLVLGTLALGVSELVTLASVIFFGWVLLAGGVVQMVHAFGTRRWQGFLRHVFGGLLAVIVGLIMVANPAAGALSITLLLAAFFLVGGLMRLVGAVALDFPGRGWAFVSGAVSVLLGIMIWRQWPVSAVWVIGTFVGIDMIFDGWSLVMLGTAARRLPA